MHHKITAQSFQAPTLQAPRTTPFLPPRSSLPLLEPSLSFHTPHPKLLTESRERERVMESKPGHTIKFLCSYGGKILPRVTDGELRYAGGHTRVLTVDRSISFQELMVKLGELCGSFVTLRCQLPNGDLETLISVTGDEDLANIIDEYDRASSKLAHPLKIRAILSSPKSLKKVSPPPSSSSSSVSHSPSSSSHTSAESLPRAVAYRVDRRNCSPPPPVGYPIGVRNGSAKDCWYTGQFEGSPRFLYFGPRCNNYCN